MSERLKIPNSESRMLWWLLAGVGIFTLLKGLRFPNIWAYTHYLFNYEEGLVKRGLVGALVHSSGVDLLKDYRFFFCLSYLVLASVLVLLSRWIFQVSNRQGHEPRIVALTFLSSVSLIYLAHTVGYMDHIGLALTLVVLGIRSYLQRVLAAAIVTVICLFIHEAFLVIFFPLLFVSLLIDTDTGQSARCGKGTRLAVLAAFSMVALAVTWYVNGLVLPEAAVRDAFSQAQAGTDITLRADAFEVQFRDGKENAAIMAEFWREPSRWLQLVNALAVILPSIFVMAVFMSKRLRRSGVPGIVQVLVHLAAVSPLVLNLIAWDIERFAALSVMTAFLVYLIVLNQFRTQDPPDKPGDAGIPIDWPSGIAFAVVLLNFNSTIQLFDGYVVAQFPFPALTGHAFEVLLSRANFFEIPAL